MPPRKFKKKPPPKVQCDHVEGERFHAPTEDVFKFNWWEVFCFPYILCSRVWDCFVSMCSGTNQCLVYWMMIQWCICKITQFTTPDPIIFPYYFYMFCQVILLTLFFTLVWVWFGKTVVIPFFIAAWEGLIDEESPVKSSSNATLLRLAFRRYCFRKGEIIDTAVKNDASSYQSTVISNILLSVLSGFVHDLIHQ